MRKLSNNLIIQWKKANSRQFHFPHCQQLSFTNTIKSSTMILLRFVLLMSTPLVIHGQLYKRIVLNADEFSKLIHKTIPYNIKTKIECGAACSYHKEDCDLFVYKNVSYQCHIGITGNENTNFLTGQIPGEYPVYFNVG